MSYIEKISNLLHRRKTEDSDKLRPTFFGIMHLLGCQTKWGVRNYKVSQPSTVDDAFVRKTLVELLCEHVSELSDDELAGWSIIDGLTKNRRWCEALQSLEGSYALAYLAASVAQDILKVDQSAEGSSYRERREQILSLRMPLCTLFNEWLKPVSRYKDVPSTEVLFRAMFGDIWFELFLAHTPDMEIFWPSAVRARRPQFMEGITMAARESDAAPLLLPNLDIL